MKVYHIPGSLTQQKGTISYKGSIRVDGNICGRMDIKAGGNILVGGKVEGASLEAEGEIVIQGGITGLNNRLESKQSISIGGDSEGVDIRCLGELKLAGRIARCTIHTLGRINGKSAFLRDCHANALGGIILQSAECSTPGSCILKVGTNYIVQEEMSNLNSALERKRSELQHLLNNLGPMLKKALNDRDYARRMGPDIDTEIGRARNFNDEAKQLGETLQLTSRRSAQNGIACVSVVRSLQKGTQIKAERAFLLTTENTNGPISFIPDKSGGSFVSEKGLLLEMLAL